MERAGIPEPRAARRSERLFCNQEELRRMFTPWERGMFGISGQEPQGLTVSATGMEMMRCWSFVLLSWWVTAHAATTNPPTLPCQQLKG